MVKLQLAEIAIAKSRLQIKSKPVKSSPINTILLFLWRVHQGVLTSLLSTRRMSRRCVCCPNLKSIQRIKVGTDHDKKDFIRYACAYFLTTQQFFEWKQGGLF